MSTRTVSSRSLVAGFCVLIGLLLAAPAAAQAQFGLSSFDGEVVQAGGGPADRAAEHPYSVWTELQLNTEEGDFGIQPAGNLRDVEVDLPVGFAGNPTAAPTCTPAQFYADPASTSYPACPPSSQAGVAEFKAAGQGQRKVPIFNMQPQPGLPAQFAFKAITAAVFLDAKVRTGDDYGVTVRVPDLSQGYALIGSKVTFWGVPAAEAHDPERGAYCVDFFGGTNYECFIPGGQSAGVPPKPFLTNPTSCVGPVETKIRVRSWTGDTDSAAFTSHDQYGNPVGLAGCEEVPFSPGFSATVSDGSADSPSGMELEVKVPQSEDPAALASSHVKDVVVTLPEGMTVNPSSADGLGACAPDQIALSSPSPAACPDAAKVGTATIETPLLANPLQGAVYLATPQQNPFGSLIALYLVAEGDGVVVKVPGEVAMDPQSGRIDARFRNNPQLPFSRLSVLLSSGPRAPLRMPPACGVYEISASLTSWSRPDQKVPLTSSFSVGKGPGGGPCPAGAFAPKLSAGAANPLAGSHSPFVLRLIREDGTPELGALQVTLPEGLLGSLRGIPYCPEAALGAVSGNLGSGAAELAAPQCPRASRVGSAGAAAGAGPSPFQVGTGSAYLAGPYKKAPLSLAVVVPAIAGPFDLGNVVVRTPLRVDPASAQITAESDPLPTILHGIPLDLREVRVDLDRPSFTLNPTSCDATAVKGTATALGGTLAPVSDRFQVAGCERLGFKPKLSLKLSGPTRRTAHPALRATLKMPKGNANIGKAVVTLPPTEFLENAHIRTICTRVQYAAGSCPKASVYGYAKAWTPLLDKPLQGPVYLRSSNHTLPDLVASLDGQIHIDLAGRIDSPKGRIRNTFWAVPDAPVSKFVLTMQGGKKGLLVNNTELCRAKPRAKAEFTGQNGKRSVSSPLVKTGCGKR